MIFYVVGLNSLFPILQGYSTQATDAEGVAQTIVVFQGLDLLNMLISWTIAIVGGVLLALGTWKALAEVRIVKLHRNRVDSV